MTSAQLTNLISFPSIVYLAAILGVSALMSGLSGFGFSAIGALCLWLLPPKLGVPLLMTLSTANQLMSVGQLKADMRPIKDWWPDGPAPYLIGGAIGVPVGIQILHGLPSGYLMLIFGVFLVGYSVYSLAKPDAAKLKHRGGWLSSGVIGTLGGVIGGFTAFPGAAVVVWTGLHKMDKTTSRSIVQPYIMGMQLLSLALLAIQHPETFNSTFWWLLLILVPIVLPGTMLGVRLYRSLSDHNFRRVSFCLLGVSGAGLLMKAVSTPDIVKVVASILHHHA